MNSFFTHLALRTGAVLALAGTLACASHEDATSQRTAPADSTVEHSSTAARPPAAVSATSATSATSAAKLAGREPRVVVLGDSLTAGLGLAVEEAYPALLQQRLTAAGLKYQVVNAGVSGDTSAGGLSRLDWALDGDVRILILALGANDGLRGLPPDELKHNLSQIIERAQAKGIKVILAGMEAPPNFGRSYTSAFHDVYPSLAKQYQLPLVPFLLLNVAGITELNQRDGMHPTARGDQIVADTVWEVLEPVARKLTVRGEGSPGS